MAKTKIFIPYTCNYKIVAIASSLKDYRVSYLINEALEINLKKVDNLIIDNKKKSELFSFEQQNDLDSNSNFQYFLINNKTIGSQLLKSLKGFDYIFIIKSENDISIQEEIFLKFKELQKFKIVLKVDKLSPKDNSLIEKTIIYTE